MSPAMASALLNLPLYTIRFLSKVSVKEAKPILGSQEDTDC